MVQPVSASTPGPSVMDSNGTHYELRSCLGHGGQGSVWKTQFPERIVKLLHRGADAQALRRRLGYVKGLSIEDLPVARPLALLREPRVGYVARLLRDMIPIEELVTPPAQGSSAGWYLESGGLRRRLRLLAHVGEIFAELHGRGLAYIDVSPGNVFVSESVQHEEAWLIDADNLSHEASSVVYTPGYGAPEVVGGQGRPGSLSDAWGFAVLAFQVLTTVHPFCGDMVVDGPPEREEEAFAARLPWIYHPEDASNRASHGLPIDMVMGTRLRGLASATFEQLSPRARPGVAAWVDLLHATADMTVLCDECQSTFLASSKGCPWCGGPAMPVRMLRLDRWEPTHGLAGRTIRQLALGRDPLTLTRRLTRGESGPQARLSDGQLTPVERGIEIQCTGLETWLSRENSREKLRPMGMRPFTVPSQRDDGWLLHFGPPDQPHRVLRLGGA